MKCKHCGSSNVRFLRAMTNVDKYWCRHCKKTTFVSHENSPDHPSKPLGPIPPGAIPFMAFNHQGKADRFLDALNHGGKYFLWDTNQYRLLKFILTDTDILGRRYKLDTMRQRGVGRFFVYPHAARPDLVNDIYKEWAHVTAHFVTSQGHVEVMEAFGYSRPLVPVGWTLCPIRDFQPKKDPRKVLFAPIHPRCSKVDQDVNRETFRRLERLARKDDIELEVRFIRSLSQSGLERIEHPNITYSAGVMNGDYRFLDEPDVVVGHQTVAWKAVARGTPTVMMAEDMPTHVQMRDKPVVWARNWKHYEHLLAYPLDILATRDTLGVLRRAVKSDCEIADWRRRMIGGPFRRDRFLAKLESFL